MPTLCSRLWMSLGALLLLAAPARAGFVVTDLGIFTGGSYSQGNGINRSGVVSGTGTINAFQQRAFSGAGSGLTDLGTLDQGRTSSGFGINDAGLVTGDSEIKINGLFRTHAFRSQGAGALQDMGVLAGDVGSSARSINDSGHIAGWSTSANGSTRAMMAFAPQAMTAIASLGGVNSKAFGINNSDVVVGESETTGGFTHAFRASGGTVVDLGTLAGSIGSSAHAINNNNDVVGYTTGAYARAFLSKGSGGQMIDLGILPFGSSSAAWGINDSQHIVGEVDYNSGGSSAFLWLPTKATMYDLNTLIAPNSGWQLLSATAINATSQITGYGFLDGEMHAYRLDPIRGQPLDKPPVTVPEPQTIVLTLVAGFTIALWTMPGQIRKARTRTARESSIDCPEASV